MNSKNRIATIILVIVIVIILVCIGVSGGRGNNKGIQIGAIMALTGSSADQGNAILNGMKWKIDELNQSGSDYKLLSEDSKTDVKEGVSAFNKLVTIEGVRLIFSHLSGISLAVKPLAEQNKVLQWAYSAYPEVTNDSSYVLRHAYDSAFDSTALTENIIGRGLKRVYIVYQQEPYGQSFNKNLTKDLTDKGVAVDSVGVDNKSPDFRTELTKAKSFNPDAVVFVIIGNGAGLVVKQIKEIGYKGDIYSSAGFAISPGAIAVAGQALSGMYYQTDQYDPTQNTDFTNEYMRRFGIKAQINAGLGYIDIEILDQAIKQVGTDPLRIVNYIKSLGSFQGKYQKVNITTDGSIVIPTVIKVWQ